MWRKTVLCAVSLAALFLVAPGSSGWAGTCSSSTGCADCDSLSSGPVKCSFVNASASCTCTISFFGGSPQCALDGVCTYTPPGGGGSGGTGGGGSGCTRTPGEWGPAPRSSAKTPFWYCTRGET